MDSGRRYLVESFVGGKVHKMEARMNELALLGWVVLNVAAMPTSLWVTFERRT